MEPISKSPASTKTISGMIGEFTLRVGSNVNVGGILVLVGRIASGVFFGDGEHASNIAANEAIPISFKKSFREKNMLFFAFS